MKHLLLALSSVGLLLSPLAVMAATPNGTCLLKGRGPALYAPMPDGSRLVFPNAHTWASWYVHEPSCVQNVPPETLADMPLSGMVTVRPGSSLLKTKGDPRVYAIDAPNVLRWIASEATAKALYGETWQKKVVDMDETLLATYQYGAPIVDAANFDLIAALSAPRPWDVPLEERPQLRIVSRVSSNLVELGITVPAHAKYPTSLVDVSVREQDRLAMALCDKDCTLTVQLNKPGIFQAMAYVGKSLYVSNKISIDPGEMTATTTRK